MQNNNVFVQQYDGSTDDDGDNESVFELTTDDVRIDGEDPRIRLMTTVLQIRLTIDVL